MVNDSERNNAILREMERTSLDMIRIYNPTDNDFTILWDGHKFLVPHKNKDVGYGKGMRVVQRYLAMWYLKHMTDKIITDKQDQKYHDLREKYEKAGVEDSLLKAQLSVERDREMRTDNETEVKRIADIIWLGIEEKYGMDVIESEKPKDIDQRTLHEQVADSLSTRVYKKPEEITTKEVFEKVETLKYPINKNKKLVQEVSQ